MLDEKGFDNWANEYDKSVIKSREADAYPFAGYDDVLNEIYKAVIKKERAVVFDIGFGTAVLTKRLYDSGCTIYGMDFSKKMIECAKEKMPDAKLVKADFSKDFPKDLEGKKFDFIISTYAFHHLNDSQKIKFIKSLFLHLNENGTILIGDVAFKTESERKAEKEKYIDIWDNDEFYTVFESLNKELKIEGFSFKKISHCAGIIKYQNTKSSAE